MGLRVDLCAVWVEGGEPMHCSRSFVCRLHHHGMSFWRVYRAAPSTSSGGWCPAPSCRAATARVSSMIVSRTRLARYLHMMMMDCVCVCVSVGWIRHHPLTPLRQPPNTIQHPFTQNPHTHSSLNTAAGQVQGGGGAAQGEGGDRHGPLPGRGHGALHDAQDVEGRSVRPSPGVCFVCCSVGVRLCTNL